jgi:phage terminase large subunit-like protein
LGKIGERIPAKAWVTIGFDGARMRDSTAFVVTDIKTGFQQLGGLWSRPPNADDHWEVDEAEVSDTFAQLMRTYRVRKVYCDPPYWNTTIGEWAVKYPDVVEEWWTNKHTRMIGAIQGFSDAIASGKLSHDGDIDLAEHVGNAGKHMLNGIRDERGERKWILGKLHQDRKFDACMAAILSWQARMDELGSVAPKRRRRVQRIR